MIAHKDPNNNVVSKNFYKKKDTIDCYYDGIWNIKIYIIKVYGYCIWYILQNK